MPRKSEYMWVYSPRKPKPAKVPPEFKTEVQARGDLFVETVLKPRCLRPAPKNPRFNYIGDIYAKWFRSYFYFCAKYIVPGPNAMVPFFEAKQARLEYVGERKFNLAWMRHTGEWVEMDQGLTLEKCLDEIKNNEIYFIC